LPENQRRHIAVSPQERRQLEEAKAHYEQQRGRADWGSFLAVVTGIGLAALGVYAVTRPSRRNATTWQVACPACQSTFLFISQSPPKIAQVTCPNCEAELVVDFSVANSEEGERLEPGEPILLYCHHCQRQLEIKFWGTTTQEVEYLRCPFCGGVAIYGTGQVEPG
jgi:DNA-directed RNA polymerase subunit RPC12/RpoP